MERNITEQLKNWKDSPTRKPLILTGARQIGKTYTLKAFGERYYRNTVYVNFERMQVVADYYNGDLDPKRIFRFLGEYFHQPVLPEETLVIYDEIQACERALTSLKYVCEEAPQYHVVAAGSLLGVAVNRKSYSFPVGKVDELSMYPLAFDEFVNALGEEHLVSVIQEHFAEISMMPVATHDYLLELYRTYLFVGGMPAVVERYAKMRNTDGIQDMQMLIRNTYVADMARYATEGETVRIRAAYASIPAQLAKENHKFQYKFVRRGATAALFGDSIEWLKDAGTVLACDRISSGEVPISVSRDVSAFKLYMLDVGILSESVQIQPENIARGELSAAFKGALAENFIAEQLRANGHDLYYWTSDSPDAEVDFVIQKQGLAVPIEVKSNDNVKSKSLMQFIHRYEPCVAYRLSQRNFGTENGITSVPLYAAWCI